MLERDGHRVDVLARPVRPGPEYDDVMRQADDVYVGFARYRRRVTRRAVPVFFLTPRPG